VFFDAKPLMPTGKGLPDGLKVRPTGHLFATGPGGVLVIDPDGQLLGRILTGRPTANVAFGGAEGNQLFITADDLLMRVALVPGDGE
jgi:gluconolactonase